MSTKLFANQVERVRLVVDLKGSRNGEAPLATGITLDLSTHFRDRQLEDVVMAARAIGTILTEAVEPKLPEPGSAPKKKPRTVSSKKPRPPSAKSERPIEKRRSSSKSPRAELVPIEQPDQNPVRLKPETIIGRSRFCDVSLSSEKVSRRHFSITFAGGKFIIRDLQSANKTWVNGSPIGGPVALEDGDVVFAGDQRFQFRMLRPGRNPP